MAFNRAGNSTDLDVAFDYFRIESQGDPVPYAVGADGTVGGSVPATLSLTLGTPVVFGAFGLAQPLQARASSAGGSGGAFAPVGGSASPTTLLTYNAPRSNDAVAIGFKQTIGRTEPLRTGNYSKTLTFTLATTNP